MAKTGYRLSKRVRIALLDVYVLSPKPIMGRKETI